MAAAVACSSSVASSAGSTSTVIGAPFPSLLWLYDEGVDQNYLGAPQDDGLGRIHERMDEMTAQQQAIVEALQTGDGYGYEDDDDYEDGEQPTVEELAAQYGVSPEELVALSEQYAQAVQERVLGIDGLYVTIDRAINEVEDVRLLVLLAGSGP